MNGEFLDLLAKETIFMKYLDNRIIVRNPKGTGKTFSIPCNMTRDIAYLAGCIIGDGHLHKEKYRVIFETVELPLMKKFITSFNHVFNTSSTFHVRREMRKNRQLPYRTEISGKPFVLFFERVFDIPRGKKSDVVRVPEVVWNSTPDIQYAFLEGIFDTDGGRRHGQVGVSSASVHLRDDLCDLLNTFHIKTTKDQWYNKKTHKRYYGFYCAGVPKRPKGLESISR